MKYQINNELVKAQPELSAKEFAELISSISEVGQTNPLVLCTIGDDTTKWLFDGHHRAAALDELMLEADISNEVLHFGSISEAVTAMQHNNDYRRQRISKEELQQKIYEAAVSGELNEHGTNRFSREENFHTKTSQDIADETGFSKRTVTAVRKEVKEVIAELETPPADFNAAKEAAQQRKPVEFPTFNLTEEVIINHNSKWANPYVGIISDEVELAQAYFRGFAPYANLYPHELCGKRLIAAAKFIVSAHYSAAALTAAHYTNQCRINVT